MRQEPNIDFERIRIFSEVASQRVHIQTRWATLLVIGNAAALSVCATVLANISEHRLVLYLAVSFFLLGIFLSGYFLFLTFRTGSATFHRLLWLAASGKREDVELDSELKKVTHQLLEDQGGFFSAVVSGILFFLGTSMLLLHVWLGGL